MKEIITKTFTTDKEIDRKIKKIAYIKDISQSKAINYMLKKYEIEKK